MKETYREALKAVLIDEGGYTNHPLDRGGPTNFGITLADAQTYWKPNATAVDVRIMPIEVAYEIYRKHYAETIHYDDLPAGIDYAVLDFGINSGVSRSVKFLQKILKVDVDGKIGLVTLVAAAQADQNEVIRTLYKARLKFLRRLDNYPTFGRGWERRCKNGLALALNFAKRYPTKPKIRPPQPSPPPEYTAPIDPAVLEEVSGGAKALPSEPEVKAPIKSKTIWGGILGWVTGAIATVSAIFEHLDNKWALIAFLSAGVVGTVALWLIVKGRLDIGKVAEALKEEE